MYLKTFLNNGSYLLDSMWPGTNKAGSCLLAACFKLLLLHGFLLFEYMRNSLDGFCQHFLQQILLRALQLTIRSSVRIDYKLNCASYKVYECNLVFVGLCTQDEDITISWWWLPLIRVSSAKCGIGCNSKLFLCIICNPIRLQPVDPWVVWNNTGKMTHNLSVRTISTYSLSVGFSIETRW